MSAIKILCLSPSQILDKIRSLDKSDWIDIANFAGVVALGILTGAAALHLGPFALLGNTANYIACGAAIGMSIITSKYLIEFVSLQVKKRNSALLRTYGHNRSASKKLRFQLEKAIKEGNSQTKNVKDSVFEVDPKKDTATIPDIGKIISIGELMDSNITSANVGATEAQGVRTNMEDAHVVSKFDVNGQTLSLYGIFDGHGDEGVASQYMCNNFPELLKNKLSALEVLDEEHVANVLTEACVELDKRVFREIQDEDRRRAPNWKTQALLREGGTTASCMLTVGKKHYIFNVGDSRTVLFRDDGAFQLTEDADLGNERFRKAVEKIKGNIISEVRRGEVLDLSVKGYRVARDIGIRHLPSRPKITVIEKGINDVLAPSRDGYEELGYQEGDYAVIACDGLWDVATNEEVARAIHAMKDLEPAEMAARLVGAALEAGSYDNISVMVVKL